MTTTREAFHMHLADAAWEGMRNSDYDNGSGGQQIDGFRAVYGQALADMVRKFDEAHLEMVAGLVREWADEIGLDLEREP